MKESNLFERNNIPSMYDFKLFLDTTEDKFLTCLKPDIEDYWEHWGGLLNLIVYLWQQNARECYTALNGTEFMRVLDESMEVAPDRIFYRGVNNTSKADYIESKHIVSASDDYSVAYNWATRRNNGRNGLVCTKVQRGIVLHMRAKECIPVHEFSSVDNEREYLIKDFEIVEIEEVEVISMEVNK